MGSTVNETQHHRLCPLTPDISTSDQDAFQTQHPIKPACTCVTLLVRFALSVLTAMIIELIVVNKEV